MRPIPGGWANAATLQWNARHPQIMFMYRQAFNRPIFLLTDNRNLSRVGLVCRGFSDLYVFPLLKVNPQYVNVEKPS